MTLTAWLGPLLMLTPLGPMNDHRANDLRPWNGTWPMFGGNPSRNMVNEVDRNLPADWCVEEGKLKNIAWQADLGSALSALPSWLTAESSSAPRTAGPAIPPRKIRKRC